MRLSSIAAVCALATITLTACAAPETSAQHQNQPHLPPPVFSASEASTNTRYCGVRGTPEDACETGEFCRRTIGDICGAADAPGICSPIPDACAQVYTPVCGCDGQTYSNECTANSQGISASYMGECKP